MTTASRLDHSFVDHWSAAYLENIGPDALELRLLNEVGPRARARGRIVQEDFRLITRWKSPRSTPRVAANAPSDIEAITALVPQTPEHLRHRILRSLSGVGTPVASAVLTVWWPDRFTVTDFRARESLRRLLDDPGVETLSYWAYVELCRELAGAHAGGDLRRLDRALWQWSKRGYPT